MRSAVVVVDTELVVQIWNRQSEDLWGLRPEEAVGQHLLNLDVGISTDRLRPLVRHVLNGGSEPAEVTINAVTGGDGRCTSEWGPARWCSAPVRSPGQSW
ncbi:PAS domain-containing protein [Cryptosporangium minutisporangium]|uniref:PAS domain-containing protein n=1 Tax=Cryptosporangium minutisporangium TaxID=113569 RepID=UPI0031EFBE3A